MPKKKGNQERDAGAKVDALIARFQTGLAGDDLKVWEAEEIVEQLGGLADDALPRLSALLRSPEADTRMVAITLLRELGDRRAVPALRRLLFDEGLEDEEKAVVIVTLGELGAPVDETTFQRAISDPTRLMRDALEHVLELIEAPEHAEALLDAVGQGPPEVQEDYIREFLGAAADRRLLLLFSAFLHSEYDNVVLATVEVIERLKEPATIPLLEERGQHDPSPRVRHDAGNAALRLKARIGDRPARGWTVPSPLPIAHCWLSTIDGSGGQVLFVVRARPDGTWGMVDLMFNDHEGIKDCFSVVISESELGDMLLAFEPIDFVDVDLERARFEVERAYHTTLAARRRLPPKFMIWQGWLEGEDARPLQVYPLPSLDPACQAELLAQSEQLLGLDEFEFWFFNPEEVADFVPRYRKLRRKRRKTEADEAAYEALVDEAIKALVDEACRGLLTDRLRRQAWLLAQLYEDEEVALWALAAAAALDAGVLVEHPLLRGMVDYSLYNAVGK